MNGRRSDEGGFSLIELLAVISILGVISFALTEAVIIGFKTTDATVTDVSRSVAVQALQSYFTGDAQSAEKVSTRDPDDPDDPNDPCSPVPEGVFLHLSWADQGRARDVSYALVPDGPAGEVELIRRSWTGCGPPDTKMLGHFTFDPAGPPPVLALCDGVACPDDIAAGPATITLKIPTRRPQEATPDSTTTSGTGATTTTAVGSTTTTPLPPGVDLTVRRRTS